jgi:hypothetical protein
MALTPENEKMIDRLLKSEDPAMVSIAMTILERYTAPIRKKRTAQPKREPEPQTPEVVTDAINEANLKSGSNKSRVFEALKLYPSEGMKPEVMAIHTGLNPNQCQSAASNMLGSGVISKGYVTGTYKLRPTTENFQLQKVVTPKKVAVPLKLQPQTKKGNPVQKRNLRSAAKEDAYAWGLNLPQVIIAWMAENPGNQTILQICEGTRLNNKEVSDTCWAQVKNGKMKTDFTGTYNLL